MSVLSHSILILPKHRQQPVCMDVEICWVGGKSLRYNKLQAQSHVGIFSGVAFFCLSALYLENINKLKI